MVSSSRPVGWVSQDERFGWLVAQEISVRTEEAVFSAAVSKGVPVTNKPACAEPAGGQSEVDHFKLRRQASASPTVIAGLRWR